MKVSDLMSEHVFTVAPDTPLAVVANRMLEYGVSGMPVVAGSPTIPTIRRVQSWKRRRPGRR